MLRHINQLTNIVNGVSALDRISGLIGQDGFQKVPSDGWIGVQERRPRSVNHINRVCELHRNLSVSLQLTGINERIVPHLFSVSLLLRASHSEPRTLQEGHNVVLTRKAAPSSGQLDVSEQLTNGQSENVRVVAVLWRDGQCVGSQLIVEIGCACQGIGVVIEDCTDLRGVT